jgi:hypothetical protein
VRALFFASCLVVCACSGKVVESAEADAATDSMTDTASDTVEETLDPEVCAREAEKVSSRISGSMCTTTVRISEATSNVIAWSVDCGRYSGALVDEASARKALATYPEYTTIDSFNVLTKGSPTTPWIFGQSPGDFGGEGAVDARTGLAVYYANLSWSSLGDVVLPTASAPAPAVCGKTTDHGYGVAAIGAAPKTDARAVDALEKTPILRGIERMHAIVGITLLYVPLDGTLSDPGYVPKNEWVALVESTLLE